jgi:hypothetical protein
MIFEIHWTTAQWIGFEVEQLLQLSEQLPSALELWESNIWNPLDNCRMDWLLKESNISNPLGNCPLVGC